MTLRSRLLAAFLALALIPTAVISGVALLQLSRAIGRWYRPGVDRALMSGLEVTKSALTRLESTLLAHAESWALRWPDGPGPGDTDEAQAELRESGFDFLQIYARSTRGWALVSQASPPGVLLANGPELGSLLPAAGEHPQIVRSRDGVLAAVVATRKGRVLATGVRWSPDYFAQIDSVTHGLTYYRRLGVTAELQRRVVLVLVAGMTAVLILLSLYLSARLARQMSRPLQDLSAALGRVAGGELGARVAPSGAAEFRSLGDSFNTMTRRLDEARQALQQAEREAAWRDVARKLAHEFKNTLTPMQLSLQLLEARLEHAPPEARDTMARSLAAVLREVENLNRLAGQFSQYARLPEPAFEPLDALDAAHSAAALVAGTAIEVRRAGTGSTLLRADRVLLSRALNNLLLNAREASSDAAPVEVVVTAEDARVQIEVLDRGPGLPQDLRDRLFEPYVSTKRRGSGLGLSLVRDIARQHRGSVGLEDREGGGARAVLILPRDPENLRAATAATVSNQEDTA